MSPHTTQKGAAGSGTPAQSNGLLPRCWHSGNLPLSGAQPLYTKNQHCYHGGTNYRDMNLTHDTKYQITHSWYEQLLGGYQRILQEPRASALHFNPNDQRTIVEIGVYEGASTCWWSDNWLDHPGSRLYSIDPFKGNVEYQQNPDKFPTLPDIELIARSNVAKSKHPGKVLVIKNASWDEFPSIATDLRIDKRQIDILYVDGEHTSTAVCRDLSLYVPLVRPGGAIIIDDYGHEDVRRGVDGALAALNCIENAFYTGWQLWCVKN